MKIKIIKLNSEIGIVTNGVMCCFYVSCHLNVMKNVLVYLVNNDLDKIFLKFFLIFFFFT
jgi:hypothetical protein